MKYTAILSLLLAMPIAALTTHQIATAQTSNQPVEVRVTVAPPGGEYKIESSLTTFSKGVTYRFVVRNAGSQKHDWMIMPKGETDDRKALVSVEEDDLLPNSVVVRELTFSQAGEFELACHYRNHYEKGMKLAITVK